MDGDEDEEFEDEGIAGPPFVIIPYIREDKPKPSGSLVQGFGVECPSLLTPGGRAESRRQQEDPAQLAWDREGNPEAMVPYIRTVHPRVVADRMRLCLEERIPPPRSMGYWKVVSEHSLMALAYGDAVGAVLSLRRHERLIGDARAFVCRVVRACLPEAPGGYGDGETSEASGRCDSEDDG